MSFLRKELHTETLHFILNFTCHMPINFCSSFFFSVHCPLHFLRVPIYWFHVFHPIQWLIVLLLLFFSFSLTQTGGNYVLIKMSHDSFHWNNFSNFVHWIIIQYHSWINEQPIVKLAIRNCICSPIIFRHSKFNTQPGNNLSQLHFSIKPFISLCTLNKSNGKNLEL